MSYPIGIDLGTSNSVVCVRRRGALETVAVDGRATMPSAISVRPDGTVLVGGAAKSRAMLEPTHSITSAKRFIGDGKTLWEIGERNYTPVDAAALVLARLKEAAEKHLGEKVSQAIITVPAYFNNAQKSDTQRAAQQAGLEVLQLLPEPTAAAIAYGLDKGRDQTILVYDLGGGTFDVSLLQVQGNRFKVLAVDGDFHLGGDDFDALLVEHIFSISGLEEVAGGAIASPQAVLAARLKVKEAAERAKIELSESESARIVIPDILGATVDAEIRRDDYNRMIAPLVERTVGKVREVLKAAKMSADDVDRVILVGGSTRNALVRQRVAEAIKEPYTSDRVDEVVAQGAAIAAASMLSPDQDDTPLAFENVTPFALGVCASDARDATRFVNSIIIPKNAAVPTVEARPYEVETSQRGPNELIVYMLQGENPDPAECLAVGKYIFSGVSHHARGRASVEIEYGYDRSGLITAKAWDKATNQPLPLQVESLSEDSSWLTPLRQNTSGFNPNAIRLVVTSSGFDDIGKVLRSLKLPFKSYQNSKDLMDGGQRRADICFINCGTSKPPAKVALREFVESGGCLYVSDLANSHLDNVFPGLFSFAPGRMKVGHVEVRVVDPELQSAMGTSMRVHFDMPFWTGMNKAPRNGQAILTSAKDGKPLMAVAPFGQGRIFFTSFHNHAQNSEEETKLLQLLVMKQISVVSGIPIEVVNQALKSR